MSKAAWWKLWCQNTSVTDTLIELSRSYGFVPSRKICIFRNIVSVRTMYTSYLLVTKLRDNNIRKLPPTREALRLHVFRSTYAAGWIWGVTLKRNVEVPSPVEWGWKYSPDRKIIVDWCAVTNVNLNDYFFTFTCKGFCTRCKCITKEAPCLPYCNCICVATAGTTHHRLNWDTWFLFGLKCFRFFYVYVYW